MYSVELYRRLQQSEHPAGWVECGGIRLASSPERMEEIRRQISWATAYGLPLQEISPAEAQELFPLLDTDGCRRRAPTSPRTATSTRRSSATRLRTWRAARACRCTRTPGSRHRRRAAAGSPGCTPTGATSTCETVVDCGGMFAAEIGRLVGVRIPLVPMSHQYVVTEALPDRAGRPAAADAARPGPARLLPAGGRRSRHGRLRAARRAVDAPTTGPTTPMPADFNGRLLPEELGPVRGDHRQLAGARARDGRRGPAQGHQRPGGVHAGQRVHPRRDRGRRLLRRGRLLRARHRRRGRHRQGDGRVDRLDGDPGMDVWHMDVRRFGRQYRSPSYTLDADARELRDLLRHRLPRARARGRPAAAHDARPTRGTPRTARRSARSPAGSGSTTTSRNAAAGDESVRPRGLGRPATGRPRSASEHARDPRGGGAVRRVVVRQADGDRAGRGGAARVGV